MRRLIDFHLDQWKKNDRRKPLLLRGARQVGKTFAVREHGKKYENFVEINFEKNISAKKIFEGDLEPGTILSALSLLTKRSIIKGKTLLFLDEIQECPRAIIALRYFYELLPELHVIAAGSLLEFAIEQVGVPVGRVSFLHMYPLSFAEYLAANGNQLLLKDILNRTIETPMSPFIHEMALRLLSEYLALGGMPEVIDAWLQKKSPSECFSIQSMLLDGYRSDFPKYAKKNQIPYVELIFEQAPKFLGSQLKFSQIPGEYRKRELAPAFRLLNLAGVIHEVHRSAGNGLPLGAESSLEHFKPLFLDIGLAQTLLGFDLSTWFLQMEKEWVNKGAIVEAFVGQELLAYGNPINKGNLYYWKRESASSQAEVDYLFPLNHLVIPIEVKSGEGRTLRSMKIFLDSHPKSPYGIRLSTHNYSLLDNIKSYPLYALPHLLRHEQKEAFEYMLTEEI